MDDKHDKRTRPLRRIIRRRRLSFNPAKPSAEAFLPRGYDPELLYVECGRCGAPVLWEPGRATRLLDQAGVDPLELDSSCMLVTDACPACGQSDEYSVRIFRVSNVSPSGFPPTHGHA